MTYDDYKLDSPDYDYLDSLCHEGGCTEELSSDPDSDDEGNLLCTKCYELWNEKEDQ